MGFGLSTIAICRMGSPDLPTVRGVARTLKGIVSSKIQFFVFDKCRRAIIGGMDATKEFIFIWHFKVVQMNRGSFKKKGGTNCRAPWSDFTGAMGRPLNQKA
jgi:hypothetical protein